ncbi:hypothetical protein [Actinophytocola sp.]|uniref:hypothetical protein n=1 Tax=Actinophytocola sp. TaxID=1872138 RepID=UPI002ED42CD1
MGSFNAAFEKLGEATRGITSGTFTVSRDNVLAAARIIDSTAEMLFDATRHVRRDLEIRPPGNDQVSLSITDGWNAVLFNDDDSYRSRITDYVVGLRKLAVQLGDTARAYGISEGEIEAAFGNTSG